MIGSSFQATQGSCNTPKPGMLDFVNKVKWDAWNSLGSMSQVNQRHLLGLQYLQEVQVFYEIRLNLQDDARQQYCDLIGSLVEAEGGSSAQLSAQPVGGEAEYNTLLVTSEDGITTIKLNRPAKKNAITTEVCVRVCARLRLMERSSHG